MVDDPSMNTKSDVELAALDQADVVDEIGGADQVEELVWPNGDGNGLCDQVDSACEDDGDAYQVDDEDV